MSLVAVAKKDLTEDEQKMFDKVFSENKKTIYIPDGKKVELRYDVDMSEYNVIVGKGVTFINWPLVQIKVGMLIALGEKDKPIEMTVKYGLPDWYGINIKSGIYADYLYIRYTTNIKEGAINVNDSDFIYFRNMIFENNKTNIVSTNSYIKLLNSGFSTGRWAIKASNSIIDITNITCANNMEFCITIYDSKAIISGVDMRNINAWGFNITGPAADVTISSVYAEDVSALVYRRYSPKISIDKNSLTMKNVRLEEINMDTQEIYNEVINQTADDFFKEYQNFVERDPNDLNRFYFLKKPDNLASDMIIPAGITVEILPGTVVKLEHKTGIVVYGNLIAKGTSDNKIKFLSDNKEGKPWGTVLLRGENTEGIFENCVFDNGGGEYLMGFDYTGSLTAHFAKSLTVRNSEFIDNKNDDALNCKYTSCLIEDNVFSNNTMDAIDFDYGKNDSIIRRNKFYSNGNDSIDLSGSKVTIYDNEIYNSGDKCISIGEDSNPNVYNNLFQECNIGIEAKDNSAPIIGNNIFIMNNIALSAYMKKYRFGKGGTIVIDKSEFVDNGELMKVDEYSVIKAN